MERALTREITLTFIAPTGFCTPRLARLLDSLVRVSRRVERGHFTANGLSVPTTATGRVHPTTGAHCEQIVPAAPYPARPSSQTAHAATDTASPRSDNAPLARPIMTDSTARRPTSPCGDDATSDRRWLVSGEVRHDSTTDDAVPSNLTAPAWPPSPAESTRERCWPHSLLQRLHVLFNSRFKVLFIFPSRYFFGIGLVPLFSFRWSLLLALGCIPKQPDSWKVPRGARTAAGHGILTLCDVPFRATWTADRRADSTSQDYRSPTRGGRLTA